MKVLAVTACPVGIAHTYMAAENLQKAAEELDIDIKVETQGSIGVENELSTKDIESAEAIIIAADKDIEKDRFAGKPLIIGGVQDGIRHSKELLQRVKDGNVPVYKQEQQSVDQVKQNRKQKENPIYRHLMNGVSYMVPFIVVGGLLTAIALTLGGEQTPEGIVVPEGTIWSQIEALGAAGFSFMVPILAGFIAVSIADRPGLVPGLIGGYIAANGSFYGSEADAGFIGGIIAGFLAGYITLAIKKIKVPQAVQPVMPIIIIPIISTTIVGLLFILVIGAPVAQLFEGLTSWLSGMQGASSILLALILGGMIAIDMGGPFNKVAFLFGSAMIIEGNYEIMGAIAVAICIPPVGLGLASMINKKKFNKGEQETGKASFTMGLFGITEGAIPFAAQDPLRVIPSIVIGSMTGSIIAMIGGVGDRVAHGGPIVAVLGAVDNVIMFFVAAAAGILVTVGVVSLLKKKVDEIPVVSEEEQERANTFQRSEQDTQESAVTETEMHQLTDIMNHNLIKMQLVSETKEETIKELVDKLDKEGILTSKDTFYQAILEREEEGTTGLGMHIAIPHGKSTSVRKPAVVFGIRQEGVEWNSMDDKKAKLIFMIAVPEEAAGDAHLKILQMLSRKLMDEDYRKALLEATDKQEIWKLLEEVQ
ncbi:fructose-specific PTS transporter subunit EIIC [Oceanobacillus locisalsi]|uniref:Fructose-specific PTS transporter subunit EIIC n=1 Tax=Oceanobacillus locisalsi TaxID=546107 RepID=A0ABW3NGI6_9BACI